MINLEVLRVGRTQYHIISLRQKMADRKQVDTEHSMEHFIPPRKKGKKRNPSSVF